MGLRLTSVRPSSLRRAFAEQLFRLLVDTRARPRSKFMRNAQQTYGSSKEFLASRLDDTVQFLGEGELYLNVFLT